MKYVDVGGFCQNTLFQNCTDLAQIFPDEALQFVFCVFCVFCVGLVSVGGSFGKMPTTGKSLLGGRRRNVREKTNRSTQHVGFAQSPERSVWSDSSSNSNPDPRGLSSTPDAAALPNEISTLHSRLSDSRASEISFDLRDSLEDALDTGRGVHDGNDSGGSDQGSIGRQSSLQMPAPVPLWAMSAWKKRENLARRRFSHQVIGQVMRGREAAHRRLLNASGHVLEGQSETRPLRLSEALVWKAWRGAERRPSATLLRHLTPLFDRHMA